MHICDFRTSLSTHIQIQLSTNLITTDRSLFAIPHCRQYLYIHWLAFAFLVTESGLLPCYGEPTRYDPSKVKLGKVKAVANGRFTKILQLAFKVDHPSYMIRL